MKPQYEPKGIRQTVDYLIEECGEVIAAAGKFQRWGSESCNPEIMNAEVQMKAHCDPADGRCTAHDDLRAAVALTHPRETNREWLLREIENLEGAIERVRKILDPT